MNSSTQAVYNFITDVTGNGIGNGTTLNNQMISVSDSNGRFASFQSDVTIEIVYGNGGVKVSIDNNQIIKATGNAIFWSTYCQCQKNGNSLDIRKDDFLINIANVGNT